MDEQECSYLLIKHDGEVLGIFKITTDEHLELLQNGTMIDKLSEAFGCTGWTPNVITQAEYETYREFGFKEYKI